MAIQGRKEVDLHRDEPPPSGYLVQVVWFGPSREGGPRHAVPTVADLRRVLAPFAGQERLVVYLERDGGEAASVWVHLTDDRAWVAHFTPRREDSYCRDRGYRGHETMGFLLSNGQLDEVHRYWTVTRAEALQAMEYFVRHGGRDPNLSWAVPRSLQEPAEAGTVPDPLPTPD